LIFERLNSGGTSLHPQEIRAALYHGVFVDLLTSLNNHASWRALFGRRSKRLKDIELVLRFFALLEAGSRYSRPMKGFLSGYMARRRNLPTDTQTEFGEIFVQTTDAILRALGSKAFKPKGALNAALVDALMVGVARCIRDRGIVCGPRPLKRAYTSLLRNDEFADAISRATADEENVKKRLRLAVAAVADQK
jgi:hypothetical protein